MPGARPDDSTGSAGEKSVGPPGRPGHSEHVSPAGDEVARGRDSAGHARAGDAHDGDVSVGGRAGTRVSEHVWVVDGLEEGVARVEVDGDQMMTVPSWLLPAAAAEGDVLRVTHDRTRARSALTILWDEEGTARELERSRRQVGRIPVARGPAGDIVL